MGAAVADAARVIVAASVNRARACQSSSAVEVRDALAQASRLSRRVHRRPQALGHQRAAPALPEPVAQSRPLRLPLDRAEEQRELPAFRVHLVAVVAAADSVAPPESGM